jgi:hypothetical protein
MMGSRADFYIGMNDPKWIGSVSQDGQPHRIPCNILVQNNITMYEELVIDFLMANRGIIESMGHPWPWPWEDSKLSDYSYFFKRSHHMVYAYSMADKTVFNPLKIMQGEDLKTAHVHIGINFPKMGVGYGPNIAKVV